MTETISLGCSKIHTLLAYNAISGTQITIATRSVDSSFKSNHDASSLARKYEFNGVSLRKINKDGRCTTLLFDDAKYLTNSENL